MKCAIASLVSAYHAIDDGTCLAGFDSTQTQSRKRGLEPFLAELTVPAVKRLLEIALPLPARSSCALRNVPTVLDSETHIYDSNRDVVASLQAMVLPC